MTHYTTELEEVKGFMNLINVSQLNELAKESYMLIDIRDEGSIFYGLIPGAINIPVEKLERDAEKYLECIDANVNIKM